MFVMDSPSTPDDSRRRTETRDRLPRTKAAISGGLVLNSIGGALLERNHSEEPIYVIVRASGEEQLILGAIAGGASAELDSP
jgi:hypothetical protein